MARDRYRVIKGLDYAGKRVEPGGIVDDIPKDSVKWLLECGAIVLDTSPDQGKRPEKAVQTRTRPGGTPEEGETP